MTMTRGAKTLSAWALVILFAASVIFAASVGAAVAVRRIILDRIDGLARTVAKIDDRVSRLEVKDARSTDRVDPRMP